MKSQIGDDNVAKIHQAPPVPIRGIWGNHPATKAQAAQARDRREAHQDVVAMRLLQSELSRQSIAFAVSTPAHGAPRAGDVLLDAAKIVVMVNSCFLNGCELHSKATKSRTKWWASKIEENERLDHATQAYWEARDWDVSVFWEHENPDDIVRHVRELLDTKAHALADIDLSIEEPIRLL